MQAAVPRMAPQQGNDVKPEELGEFRGVVLTRLDEGDKRISRNERRIDETVVAVMKMIGIGIGAMAIINALGIGVAVWVAAKGG